MKNFFFLNEQKRRDAAAKKEQSRDKYNMRKSIIPPYNHTH